MTMNGCDVTAVQREGRLLKVLVKGQFMDKTYTELWKVMLREGACCIDFQNISSLG